METNVSGPVFLQTYAKQAEFAFLLMDQLTKTMTSSLDACIV